MQQTNTKKQEIQFQAEKKSQNQENLTNEYADLAEKKSELQLYLTK